MDDARKKEILEKLAEAVVEYDEDMAKEWSQLALDENMDVFEAIMNGLAAGMETVGELYDQQEYFVPEMLMCADALYAGLDILRPHIKKEDIKNMGQVVIGTVQGGVQGLSRSLYASLIPPEQPGEFFGFYNMLGKFAAVIGPILMGLVGVLTGNPRHSILSVVILFLAGGVILYFVDEAQGTRIARDLEQNA